MEIVLATTNNNKLQEIRKILPESFKIVSMLELGMHDEIPETGNTFTENALQKARYLYERCHRNCLADDSGLEVAALDGRPGIFTARYAGANANSQSNINKLLSEMQGITNRSAIFKTVLALIVNGREFTFEGVIKGQIGMQPGGSGGFGYDPVFIPDGYDLTFAEMTPDEKNRISHRFKAAMKLRQFLQQLHPNG